MARRGQKAAASGRKLTLATIPPREEGPLQIVTPLLNPGSHFMLVEGSGMSLN